MGSRRVLLMMGVLVAMCPPMGRAAQKSTLVIGTQNSGVLGKTEFAQLLNFIDKAGEAYAEVTGRTFDVRVFKDRPSFVAAARAGQLDVLLNDISGQDGDGYRPFLVYSLFGQRAPQECLFVPQNGPDKVADLRGKRAVILQDDVGRFKRLDQLLGENPMTFFDDLRPGQSDSNMVYALALGQADAAYIDTWGFAYLNTSNPGPGKKVKALQPCFDRCPRHLYVNRRLDPALVREFQDVLMHLDTLEAAKRYRALFKTLGVGFSEYSKEDQALCAASLEDDAAAWTREDRQMFERWRRYNRK